MKKLLFTLTILFSLILIAQAQNIGVGIVVIPLNESNLTVFVSNSNPLIGQNVIFYADYEDNASNDLIPANVTISINGSSEMIYNASASAYVFNYTFTTAGVYLFEVKANKTGFESKTKNINITVKSPSLPPSGGGGGGGYFPPVNETEEMIEISFGEIVALHPPVEPMENITIFIEYEDLAFYKIEIIAAERITGGRIDLIESNCFVFNMPSERIIYDCLTIEVDGIEYSQYEDVFLYSKIKKKWYVMNNIELSTIGITKISDSREEVPAIWQKEDETYEYYYTQLDSFSTFIIYGLQKPGYCGDGICSVHENCETCPEDCGICSPVITPPKEQNCELFGYDYGNFIICWYWWVLLIAIQIIGIASYSYFSSKLPGEKKHHYRKRASNKINKKLVNLNRNIKRKLRRGKL